jgi:small subunit ribosomal protein S3
MGQKVHPVGIRIGVIKDWLSKWYVNSGEFAETVYADLQARKYLEKRFTQAAISRIEIERPARNARVVIYAARPGVIIGKSGKEIDLLRHQLSKILGVPVQVSIEEIRKPELDAKLVAENIVAQLLKRIAFRRAMKRAMGSAMRAGAKGIKVCVSGRLGGAEIARSEWAREGRLPLQTFRADIDYSLAEAKAPYGVIGVKVWIFKGEVLGDEERQ